MSLNGPHLRSNVWSAFTYTAPSGGVTAGAMGKIGDTVVVFRETKAAGSDVAAIYACDKILLPKKIGSGEAIGQGKKVYYEAASGKLTGIAGSNTLCGRCIEAAGASDTDVLVDFKGNVAA
jgi:predicted RecA/RadA family phage recombinase